MLEFCTQESERVPRKLVLLRVRLKEAPSEDVGIIVDDLISNNEACSLSTICIEEQLADGISVSASNFACVESLDDCIASLDCARVDDFPTIKQVEGFVSSEDESFSALEITDPEGVSTCFGDKMDPEVVSSTGPATSLTAPVIGLRTYHDSVAIKGVQLLSDNCVCKHARFHFDG